ncbi:MAG: DUF503 domain-containing protein [bacterium]|nr:DUF503 domain-containing protein [bacterium]
MKIYAIELTLRAPWVHSLKEKRMIVRSLVKKLHNTFNISVGEIAKQDEHQIIVIGIVGLAITSRQLESRMEEIIIFIEENTEAEIIKVKKEKDFY